MRRSWLYFARRSERESEPVLSSEVTGVHWLPLDGLLGSQYRDLMDYPYDSFGLKFPCFRVDGRTIWGLTYRMFANLQMLLEEAEQAGFLGGRQPQ